ncbi:MAG: 23S rRNA (uracil(1939)-C(5))-methyltransferase RlmD [Saprospiraceae bacterium]|nr:23S rRNA (uracil(1939)-C(5))-methyltransferase RlmD [Saprospiraceae bacterium]MBP7699413.1 23S rRNA (uracil(1939)-C(5))-methyltransferase RlmD [Saprospiraceae bacterium]
MKTPVVLENIAITGIADKGMAVGRDADGKVIFVENAVPGDIANVQLTQKKKGVHFGKVVQLIQPSSDRVEPFCQHFGVCGGCKWQYMDYAAQLHHKYIEVENAFRRIGKIDCPINPIIGAAQTRYYRNKLEFSFSNKRWITDEEITQNTPIDNWNVLGFHRPGTFDKVVDIQHCYHQADPSNAIRNAIRDYVLAAQLPFFDIRKQNGWLRTLFIRTTLQGQVMVIVTLFYEDAENRIKLLNFIKQRFPQISSLLYVINTKGNDSILDQDVVTFFGNNYIEEQLGDVKFEIGPKSFFQTNTAQAKKLYDVVVEYASLTGNENVYDLYTGIGSIALYVSQYCKQVVGIEEVSAAIDDANKNKQRNNITNVTFYAGDVRAILTDAFAQQHGKPDIVITDPPRAGMHPDVVNMLLQLAAPKIVYVSCNPATQARDLQLLSTKYHVIKSQPVDMFPHTHHIENVAVLALRNI